MTINTDHKSLSAKPTGDELSVTFGQKLPKCPFSPLCLYKGHSALLGRPCHPWEPLLNLWAQLLCYLNNSVVCVFTLFIGEKLQTPRNLGEVALHALHLGSPTTFFIVTVKYPNQGLTLAQCECTVLMLYHTCGFVWSSPQEL